jgi:hypothetical protein
MSTSLNFASTEARKVLDTFILLPGMTVSRSTLASYEQIELCLAEELETWTNGRTVKTL